MNDETRKAFFDLYLEMVLAHHHYGDDLDQIRLEIEQRGYSRSHQHDLGMILKYLKKVKDSTLSEKLQEIIDSLGSPQHV